MLLRTASASQELAQEMYTSLRIAKRFTKAFHDMKKRITLRVISCTVRHGKSGSLKFWDIDQYNNGIFRRIGSVLFQGGCFELLNESFHTVP
jgi:hypothetical protein